MSSQPAFISAPRQQTLSRDGLSPTGRLVVYGLCSAVYVALLWVVTR